MSDDALQMEGYQEGPTVVTVGEGTVAVVWPVYRHRFMFDDGSIIDVETASDGALSRRAVLAHLGLPAGTRIAGISRGAFVGWTQPQWAETGPVDPMPTKRSKRRGEVGLSPKTTEADDDE
jgi:hypothetical protein